MQISRPHRAIQETEIKQSISTYSSSIKITLIVSGIDFIFNKMVIKYIFSW